MRIVVIGGGPAGLYAALLLKQARPEFEIVVLERNQPDETFGWGVVFSDQTLENFRVADEPVFRAITESFAHWDDIDIVVRGQRIVSGGHGFSGIARRRLLNILQERARDVGVEMRFSTSVQSVADLNTLGLSAPDVIIAADGINSTIRNEFRGQFEPDLDTRSARFVWLGTTLPLDAFTFLFAENEHGVFQAHGYRFDERLSTFIVECDEASWRAAGFDVMDTPQTIAACEAMFGEWLGEHRLQSNGAHRVQNPWTRFVRVRNVRWSHANIALIGDAAHTAHFSIGSGTKLAMEDAIALARALAAAPDVQTAFAQYENERKTESLRLQNAARNSMEWFEHVKRYIALPPEQFAYSLLTRSQRVSHENLRLRDASYVAGVERWFASRAAVSAASERATSGDSVPPPMFTPFRLRGLELHNRVVVAPMDMYSAQNGTPNDFHLVHLGARALGGAALVMTEMVCVSPEGRITHGCTGLYTTEQANHWRHVVKFVHEWSSAKICLQLGHSGRKGATRLPWEGGEIPLERDAWETMGPSPIPYAVNHVAPREMSRSDMVAVTAAFVQAVQLAVDADFDMLELHAAHGYLLSSFLTPVSNLRTDEYGGTLANRLRFPLQVFRAMREVWPADRPMSVRVSATDWMEDGLTPEDSTEIGRAFIGAGADIIHVSTGQTTPNAKPVYGRMYQTPHSDRIRNEGRVPTIAVGNVTEADQVNGIIASGRADLVALGRPHLADPNWTLHAAAILGYSGVRWPKQYHLGRLQLERETERARALNTTPALGTPPR